MRIFPHMDGDQLIELVKKEECELLALALHDMENQFNSMKAYNVKLLIAFTHLETKLMNIAFDPAEPMRFVENVANHVDDLREDITDIRHSYAQS